MFADDVTFYTTGKTDHEVESKLQDQVATVAERYDASELCVTTKKSNFLLVHTKRNRNLPNLNITLNQSKFNQSKFNQSKFNQVSTMKYLGIQLSDH